MTATPGRFRGTDTYLSSEGLQAAVNCALVLRNYLTAALEAQLHGRPAPSLLPDAQPQLALAAA